MKNLQLFIETELKDILPEEISFPIPIESPPKTMSLQELVKNKEDIYINSLISDSLKEIQDYFKNFLLSPDFIQNLNFVFGSQIDTFEGISLIENLSKSDYHKFPIISVRSSSELNGASGAFSSSNNTIYLAREFLLKNQDKPEVFTSVVLEEVGHFIDAHVNLIDTVGDEGELFVNVIKEVDLTDLELQRILTEDDHAVIKIDNQLIEVEQAVNIPIFGQVAADNPVGIDVNPDGTFYVPPASLFFHISTIPSTQQTIISLPSGISFLNRNNGNVIPWINISQLNIDTSSVFDVTTNQFRNFSGQISPQFSSYGDIAVLERGNRLDILVAGKSSITPFVLRFRWENRSFLGARVMVASSGTTAGNVNLTRGIAVNNDGTVLTTLPLNIQDTNLIPEGLESLYGGFYDVPVAFNIDYPESGNFLPQFLAIDSSSSSDNRQSATDIASQGMDVDNNGNFYVVTNSTGSTALNAGEGTLLAIDKNLNQVVSVGNYEELLTSFRDVAVDASAENAYVTVDRSSIFGFGTQADRIVGFDLQETKNLLKVSSPVYRFFNTLAGGHFFTTSEGERDFVLENLPQYNYEGVGMRAGVEDGDDLLAVHRFFNTVAGGHFFTTSEGERDFVINNLPQYNYEGTGFYAYGVEANVGVDVYRFFNTVAGGHFFTTSEAERDFVINNLPQYNYEGIAFESG